MLSGEEAAFDELFARTFPGLFAFAASRLGHDGDAAEEVVQEALIRALSKLATFRGEASLFTWLCTFCRHEISAYCEKRGRAPVTPLEDDPELLAVLESLSGEEPLDLERELLKKEIARLVRLTLDHLPPRYGSALEWKYIEGISVDEIATRLQLAPKAAESVLTRARQAFRDGFSTLAAGLSTTRLHRVGGR
jgi:RNA polymerase sigma-70 factor, ECF subfamily